MNSLLKLWSKPTWMKWLVYLAIVYILFLIKEAFAIVLWFLFFVLFYTISFLLIMFLKQGPIMKKIIFSLFLLTLLSCQEKRPHGNQYNLPELTPNNYLIGNLNDNRSSYRVSFYDINIDFDIEKNQSTDINN